MMVPVRIATDTRTLDADRLDKKDVVRSGRLRAKGLSYVLAAPGAVPLPSSLTSANASVSLNLQPPGPSARARLNVEEDALHWPRVRISLDSETCVVSVHLDSAVNSHQGNLATTDHDRVPTSTASTSGAIATFQPVCAHVTSTRTASGALVQTLIVHHNRSHVPLLLRHHVNHKMQAWAQAFAQALDNRNLHAQRVCQLDALSHQNSTLISEKASLASRVALLAEDLEYNLLRVRDLNAQNATLKHALHVAEMKLETHSCLTPVHRASCLNSEVQTDDIRDQQHEDPLSHQLKSQLEQLQHEAHTRESRLKQALRERESDLTQQLNNLRHELKKLRADRVNLYTFDDVQHLIEEDRDQERLLKEKQVKEKENEGNLDKHVQQQQHHQQRQKQHLSHLPNASAIPIQNFFFPIPSQPSWFPINSSPSDYRSPPARSAARLRCPPNSEAASPTAATTSISMAPITPQPVLPNNETLPPSSTDPIHHPIKGLFQTCAELPPQLPEHHVQFHVMMSHAGASKTSERVQEDDSLELRRVRRMTGFTGKKSREGLVSESRPTLETVQENARRLESYDPDAEPARRHGRHNSDSGVEDGDDGDDLDEGDHRYEQDEDWGLLVLDSLIGPNVSVLSLGVGGSDFFLQEEGPMVGSFLEAGERGDFGVGTRAVEDGIANRLHIGIDGDSDDEEWANSESCFSSESLDFEE